MASNLQDDVRALHEALVFGGAHIARDIFARYQEQGELGALSAAFYEHVGDYLSEFIPFSVDNRDGAKEAQIYTQLLDAVFPIPEAGDFNTKIIAATHFSAEYLLDVLKRTEGQDVDLSDIDWRAQIALVTSFPRLAQSPHAVQIFQTLFDYGLDPNLTNSVDKNTFLHMATNPELVQLLLEEGVDPNVTNGVGDTPLAAHTNPHIIRLLIEAGANPLQRDGQNIPAIERLVDDGVATHPDAAASRAYLVDQVLSDPYFQINPPSLDIIGPGETLRDFFERSGTEITPYPEDAFAGPDADAPRTPRIEGYSRLRQGYLLVMEYRRALHDVQVLESAAHAYRAMTGLDDVEERILAIGEEFGRASVADGISPMALNSHGLRSLFENPENHHILPGVFVTISYYHSDRLQETAANERAQAFYRDIPIAGLSVAVGNKRPAGRNISDNAYPFNQNPAFNLIGATDLNDSGLTTTYYSEAAPFISSLTPLVENSGLVSMGTSFSAPRVNAMRLALYEGTAHLTAQEIDFILAVNGRRDVSAASPFVSNGVLEYSTSVGFGGDIDIQAAYDMARTLDEKKERWLEERHTGSDRLSSYRLMGSASVTDERFTYDFLVPEDTTSYNASFDLGVANDGLDAYVIAPNGNVMRLSTDGYGEGLLPMFHAMGFKEGDTITIVSDQALNNPTITLNGYGEDAFFTRMVNHHRALTEAQQSIPLDQRLSCQDIGEGDHPDVPDTPVGEVSSCSQELTR